MRFFIIACILSVSFLAEAQTNKTMSFEGTTREYKEYVPSIYTGTTAVPVVFCLHGLGDNMNNFSNIGMHQLAEIDNFIVITPQAMNSILGTAWNSGASMSGYVLNSNINDVGFILAILDSLDNTYNIDLSRVYACGFSMGGFMSNRLACQATDHFAAIASVSGTIGTSLNCSPWTNIPVCHFHGTIDSTVNYINNPYGSDAEDLVDYWVSFNNCDTAIHTALPDIAADGKTVDHYYYANGDNNSSVEFYKVTGGDHEWLFAPTNDITYTLIIWDFFKKHSKAPTAINEEAENVNFKLYPNPTNQNFIIESKNAQRIEVINMEGKQVLLYENPIDKIEVNTKNFNSGIYLVRVFKNTSVTHKKLIVY
jgi:polyhydroxybutyrate depolymerase